MGTKIEYGVVFPIHSIFYSVWNNLNGRIDWAWNIKYNNCFCWLHSIFIFGDLIDMSYNVLLMSELIWYVWDLMQFYY